MLVKGTPGVIMFFVNTWAPGGRFCLTASVLVFMTCLETVANCFQKGSLISVWSSKNHHRPIRTGKIDLEATYL